MSGGFEIYMVAQTEKNTPPRELHVATYKEEVLTVTPPGLYAVGDEVMRMAHHPAPSAPPSWPQIRAAFVRAARRPNTVVEFRPQDPS